MITSVASKRLFQEYKHLTQDPPDGITAGPVEEDDLFVWEALIEGPEGTPYEGGIFPAELKFPKDYPLMPPTMKFLSDIWHPNGEFYVSLHPAAAMANARLMENSVSQRCCLYLYPPPSRRRP
jgi:ubiquitin-protein ligase